MKSYYILTELEFNPETFWISEKMTFWLFSFSQYTYLSGCYVVISGGSALFYWF